MEVNELKEFKTLTTEALLAAQTNLSLQEPKMARLPHSKQLSWGSLLFSLAKSENIECLILDPLIESFQSNREVQEYLQAHSNDEVKHYRWLSTYVNENTAYRRNEESLSDIIFYKTLLPKIGQLGKNRHYLLFALMYFYELFTLDFYSELIKAATRDDLPHAIELFRHIRNDEVRHCRAARKFLGKAKSEVEFSSLQRSAVWALLSTFQFDMATFSWCVHNQRVRNSTITLGISPERMWEIASRAKQQTLKVCKS